MLHKPQSLPLQLYSWNPTHEDMLWEMPCLVQETVVAQRWEMNGVGRAKIIMSVTLYFIFFALLETLYYYMNLTWDKTTDKNKRKYQRAGTPAPGGGLKQFSRKFSLEQFNTSNGGKKLKPKIWKNGLSKRF